MKFFTQPFLFVFFLCFGSYKAAEQSGCLIDFDKFTLSRNPPFLLDEYFQIINPNLLNSTRVISLSLNQKILVGCFGSGSNTLKDTGLQLNVATCRGGDKLMLNQVGEETTLVKLGCLTPNKEILIENGTCADELGTLIQVGYLAGTSFLPLYESCHDSVNALTYYSVSRLHGRSNAAYDRNDPSPSFSQGGYFPYYLDVNNAYTQEQQKITLARILGSQALADQYIVKDKVYISRGHLAPVADFIHDSSQRASYYFFNAAPQWQPFNGANWARLENSVRNESIFWDIPLTVYTGTYGILHLPNYLGSPTPIYMSFDSNGNGLIPVPKYYWKLVHDEEGKTATAVIGINNPHQNVTKDDIFCPDVCHQIPWIRWNIDDVKNGYTFCCTAAELHKVVSYAPKLDVPLFVGSAFTAAPMHFVVLAVVSLFCWKFTSS